MENKKHIVAVNALIKNKNKNKFLIVKRQKNEIAYPGKWAFPGGKVEKGQNVLEALKREVLEEVGLEIEDSRRFLNDFTFLRPDGHNVIGFVFEVIAKSDNVKLADEFDDFKWVSPEEFKDLDFIQGMDNEVNNAFK